MNTKPEIHESLKGGVEGVYQSVAKLIRQARSNVLKSVNHEQVIAYWKIGKKIVEEEQAGGERAEYGKTLLENLSARLNREFGKGFGKSNLKYMRQFFLVYQDRICHEPRGEFETVTFNPNLSWTHYRILLKESRPEARNFYELEAAKNYWSTAQLERQMTSFLFDRLAASKNSEEVMALANQGQVIRRPEDTLKEPIVLDFLGYKEHHAYTETDLEGAIIAHLQEFLLEMGEGFAFLGRQKRITIEGDHFYPDLVFYHILLKCYVVIDLKVEKLTHGDVGQILMYVNYYDRTIKQKDDGPTIGLLLCADKNEAVVQYTLPENNQQIFAGKYQLHLPTTEQLKAEIQREYQEAQLRFQQAKEQG